jgi:hypothetical protein
MSSLSLCLPLIFLGVGPFNWILFQNTQCCGDEGWQKLICYIGAMKDFYLTVMLNFN